MLDEIRSYQQKVFNKNSFTYKRYFHHKINFNSQLTGIVGARGVGKTTLISPAQCCFTHSNDESSAGAVELVQI